MLATYSGQYKDIINSSIIVANQYIYACKCTMGTLNFQQLIDKIRENIMTEKIISTKTNRVANFYGRYGKIAKALEM